MYGDPTKIRALADRLRERADEIRALADQLTARADQVPWQGLAAEAMRAHAQLRTAALRRTALLHDDAAEALDRHARRVGWLQDTVEHEVHDLLDALPGIG